MSELAPIPDDRQDENERRRLAALAESTLKFRRSLQDASDDLLCRMILNRQELEGEKFRTPGGRNAMVVVAIGDDAVGRLTDAVYYWNHPEPEDEGPSKRDSRE